ncbi:interleukin-18 receptor 1-like [Amphiura filiformis]|uniref:interleukin-18 receptor 1-like n=1 Tax=Amphiura filiformis TaxID=82378 RepID=UPI003B21BDBB
MMVERIVCCVIFLSLCVSGMRIRGSDLCDGGKLHNPTPDNKLDYVKKNLSEWTNHELVNEGGLVRVRCEVVNFCTLEWIDNQTGKPIEEEAGYIEFEDDKQVLVLQNARLEDTRYYTCKASQAKESLEPRTILVQVLELNSEGLVPLSHPHCRNTSADIGDTVMFYCEYSVGTTNPWQGVGTYWEKQNGTGGDFLTLSAFHEEIEDDPDVTTDYDEVVEREGVKTEMPAGDPLWVYNTTLYLRNISQEAFGEYRVFFSILFDDNRLYYISLTENPAPPRDDRNGVTEVLIGIAVLIAIIGLLGIVYYKKQVDIKLFWKDNFSKEGKNDNKETDAYISYHSDYGQSEQDLNFVINVLKVKLEGQQYRVVIRDIHHIPGTHIAEEIVKSLDTCRRCILVVSPSYITSSTGNYDIKVMMDQVESCKKQIIPIVFKEVEDSLTGDTNDIKLLKHIMNNAHCLKWPEIERQSESTSEKQTNTKRVKTVDKKMDKKKELFCKELMLRMPPRPKSSLEYNTSMSQVDMISHEERPSFSTSISFQNGQTSIYPNLNSESSTDMINMATVPETSNGEVPQQHSKSVGLYPVLT